MPKAGNRHLVLDRSSPLTAARNAAPGALACAIHELYGPELAMSVETAVRQGLPPAEDGLPSRIDESCLAVALEERVRMAPYSENEAVQIFFKAERTLGDLLGQLCESRPRKDIGRKDETTLLSELAWIVACEDRRERRDPTFWRGEHEFVERCRKGLFDRMRPIIRVQARRSLARARHAGGGAPVDEYLDEAVQQVITAFVMRFLRFERRVSFSCTAQISTMLHMMASTIGRCFYLRPDQPRTAVQTPSEKLNLDWPAVVELAQQLHDEGQPTLIDKLTSPQQKVLGRLIQCNSQAEIARELNISDPSVYGLKNRMRAAILDFGRQYDRDFGS